MSEDGAKMEAITSVNSRSSRARIYRETRVGSIHRRGVGKCEPKIEQVGIGSSVPRRDRAGNQGLELRVLFKKPVSPVSL